MRRTNDVWAFYTAHEADKPDVRVTGILIPITFGFFSTQHEHPQIVDDKENELSRITQSFMVFSLINWN